MVEYLKRNYDLNDKNLVSAYDELSLWAAPFGLQLLSTIEMKTNIVALDIGSGPGFPLIELAQRLGNTSQVYGIDPWKAAIQRVKEKIHFHQLTNVEIKEGVAEDLPFEDNFFDLIVSNNGLNNVQDQIKALSECSRVAKPNAQMVLTVNLPNTMKEFYSIYQDTLTQLQMEDCISNIQKHILKHRQPVEETIKKIENAGFSIKKVKQDRFEMCFSTGSALLNYSFIKLFFLDGWKNCIPPSQLESVFTTLEANLNSFAKNHNGISLTIPFACYDCKKI
ncbi:MAG: class I SAM-dependent methyltransferase [Candidatus Hodarchaeota archaeon]